MDGIKRLVWLALFLPSLAFGFTGSGSVWAMKSGDFVATNFPGTQAGIDAAVAFCGSSGFVQIGPGLEALTPSSFPAGVSIVRVGSAGWETLGQGIVTPRLGPVSTTTTGGAIRIVDGVTFPLTVAGVQAALNECGSAGGGTVWVPASANVQISTVGIKIPNRVKLMGMGASADSIPTFQATSTCNVGALIENAHSDGTQQYAYIQNIYVRGDTSGTATDSIGIRLRSIFVGSAVRDVNVQRIKGHGIVVDDPARTGVGTIVFDNVLVANLDATEGGDGVRVGSTTIGRAVPMRFSNMDIERWGQAGAGMRLQGVNCGGETWSRDAIVDGLYMESRGDATADGLVIRDFGLISIRNLHVSQGILNYDAKIEGAATSNYCGAYGVDISNIYAANAAQDTILFDQVNNYAVTTATGQVMYQYRTPSKAPTIFPTVAIHDSLRVNGISTLIGNPTVGATGISPQLDVGTGGTGTDVPTLRLNSGNSGSTSSILRFSRNGTAVGLIQNDGSAMYIERDDYLKFSKLATGAAKGIFDFANARFRVGDGTAPTHGLEVATNAWVTDSLRVGSLLYMGSLPFASLGTPNNASIIYCTDCDPATTPCASAGAKTGALAVRQGGAWKCF